MQLPEMTLATMQWDRYRAFHRMHTDARVTSDHLNIVQFDTNEVVVYTTGHDPRPDARRTYRDLGITVVSTQDDACPDLYRHDNTPVRAAWFSRSQQILVIDHHTGVVVRLATPDVIGWKHPSIPTRFAGLGAVVWFAGPERAPVSNGDIMLYVPPTLTEAEQRLRHETRLACVAWRALSEEATAAEQAQVRTYWSAVTPLLFAEVQAKGGFAGLDTHQRLAVAQHGITVGTVRQRVERLYLTPSTKAHEAAQRQHYHVASGTTSRA